MFQGYIPHYSGRKNALNRWDHVVGYSSVCSLEKFSLWIIDLGPEGGRKGGFIVAEGTPEELAANPDSVTGRYLREML